MWRAILVFEVLSYRHFFLGLESDSCDSVVLSDRSYSNISVVDRDGDKEANRELTLVVTS